MTLPARGSIKTGLPDEFQDILFRTMIRFAFHGFAGDAAMGASPRLPV